MIREEYSRRCAPLLVLASLLLLSTCSANPYLDDGELNAEETEDLVNKIDRDYDSSIDRFLDPLQDKRSSSPAVGQVYMPMRRACIRRNGNCDNRPDDCCYNSSCRCNLWGSNCKCQRLGLFQKWGK